jgi:prephenate dehydrogenase
MHASVTIIGLDRLGTSIGLALKRYQNKPRSEHSFTITGSDPRPQPMRIAQQMGAIDSAERVANKAVEGANLIIANLPYGSVEELYAGIGPDLRPGVVVLDLSPLKQRVIDLANEFFLKNPRGQPLAYLIGITPIINFNGLYSGDLSAEAARADLFDKSDMIIAPDIHVPGEVIKLAEDVSHILGAKPHFMDPIEHDGLIAASEQLPALLGTALFYTLQQSEGWLELRRMVNPTMALVTQHLRYQSADDLFALFSQNRENLARHLENVIANLHEVREALLEGSDESGELETFLSAVQQAWDRWDVKRQRGEWDESGDMPDISPGRLFGSLGTLLTGRRPKDEDKSRDDEN